MRKNRSFCVGLALLALFTVSAHAQVHFGIKGGLNVSTAKFNKDFLEATNVSGFHIGPMLEFMIPYTGVGLDAAILYSQKGLHTNRTDITSDYIDVPVNLKWKVGVPLIKGYLSAGPYVGFLVSGKDAWDMPGSVQTQLENKSFAAGLNFGAGVELFNSLQVGFNYGLGLTSDYSASKLGEIADGKSNLMSVTAALLF
ncbi:MAG: PorT family protein [Tannerellaceae bacterium]|jgi:hypothetical protein|nr:PorT family protein [Tannerellaceae bacterium]